MGDSSCVRLSLCVSLGPVLLLSTTSRPVGILWFLGNRSFRDIENSVFYNDTRWFETRRIYVFNSSPECWRGAVRPGSYIIIYTLWRTGHDFVSDDRLTTRSCFNYLWDGGVCVCVLRPRLIYASRATSLGDLKRVLLFSRVLSGV